MLVWTHAHVVPSLSLARAVSAPLNPHYTQAEVEFYLKDTASSLLVLPPIESLTESALDRKVGRPFSLSRPLASSLAHMPLSPALVPQNQGAEQALSAARKLKTKVATIVLDKKSGEPTLKIIFAPYSGAKGLASEPLFPQVKGNGPIPEEDDVALVLCVAFPSLTIREGVLTVFLPVTRLARLASPKVSTCLHVRFPSADSLTLHSPFLASRPPDASQHRHLASQYSQDVQALA